MDGKKTEAFTVKVSCDMSVFVKARSEQGGFESPSEYIRSLLDAEHRKALSDLNLLRQALGLKEDIGNAGTAGTVNSLPGKHQ